MEPRDHELHFGNTTKGDEVMIIKTEREIGDSGTHGSYFIYI
jgi:hypothetical protein